MAMLVSGMVGTNNPVITETSTQASISTTSSREISFVKVAEAESINDSVSAPEAKTKKLDRNADVESKVRLYFKDTPIMAEIVSCESHFRQFNADGTVLRGIANNQDVGIAQVNEYYHAKRAKKLGMDIYTVEGNMEYAKLLYDEEGTDPWISSAPCWKKSDVAKAMSAASKKVLADNVK